MAQYLGAGVAACYRGFRVYDTEETKAVVKKWVEFYKVSDYCIRESFQKLDLCKTVNANRSYVNTFILCPHKATS